MPDCRVDHCSRPTKARGLCNRHYLRLLRHGRPTGGAPERNADPPEFCTLHDCGRLHESRGLCARHARRERDHGDPRGGRGYYADIEDPWESLLIRCERLDSGCWEWTAARTPDGYGVLRVDGDLVYAHRRAFELCRDRPARGGVDLHHTCRNRWCANPDHVVEMTPEAHGALHSREWHRKAQSPEMRGAAVGG